MKLILFFIVCCGLFSLTVGFASPSKRPSLQRKTISMAASSTSQEQEQAYLDDPAQRDARYGENTAQYLVDLHDSKATFDFCGGMMFQLVLTDALRDHLVKVASNNKQQPVVYDASKMRMHQIPDYDKTSNADNVHVFHGREIRKVPNAAGGMGFVLQLSLANDGDAEGWTREEVDGYNGWQHDMSRTWRNGDRLEQEGVQNFKSTFGPEAFTLNHRFYLHLDRSNRMWLSAEDGCEGTPKVRSSGGWKLPWM